MKKGYVKYLDWLFRFSYLTLGIVSFNVFLYDSRVQPFMVKVCLVVGIFAFVGRLLFFKNYIKTPYWWVLVMFCMSFFATIVSQRQYGVAGADFKWLVWTGMLFFLLYTCDGEKKIEEYKREFTVFSYFIIGYSFLASVCSLYLMSKLYNVSWYTANGELMISGFRWGRLWGVYTDPNYGAVFSVVGILLCVYHIKIAKKWKKIPYLFIIFADYMYVIFSDSRTAEIAVTAAAAFWIVFAAVHGRKGKKAVFLSILAAIIFSAAFLVGTSYVKEEYNKEIQILQKRQAEKLKKANNKNAQSKNIKKPVVGRKKDLQSDISNGRLALWESGIEIWKTKPMLGVGYNSFVPYVKDTLPKTYVVNNSQGSSYVSLHNEFINILVYHGAVGFGILLCFAICVLILWVKTVPKMEKEDGDYISVMAACVIAVGVSMFFLLEGIHTNSPGAFLLWTFLGYMMQYCAKKRKADS